MQQAQRHEGHAGRRPAAPRTLAVRRAPSPRSLPQWLGPMSRALAPARITWRDTMPPSETHRRNHDSLDYPLIRAPWPNLWCCSRIMRRHWTATQRHRDGAAAQDAWSRLARRRGLAPPPNGLVAVDGKSPRQWRRAMPMPGAASQPEDVRADARSSARGNGGRRRRRRRRAAGQ